MGTYSLSILAFSLYGIPFPHITSFPFAKAVVHQRVAQPHAGLRLWQHHRCVNPRISRSSAVGTTGVRRPSGVLKVLSGGLLFSEFRGRQWLKKPLEREAKLVIKQRQNQNQHPEIIAGCGGAGQNLDASGSIRLDTSH
jgi:hypothetical protein